MWNLKYYINGLILKMEPGSKRENEPMVTKGAGGEE